MTTDFPAAFYIPLGDDHYQPTEATAGPWSAELQHGSLKNNGASAMNQLFAKIFVPALTDTS